MSRRTVFRDLDVLRQAGVPLVFDEQRQRYSISGSALLSPTSFTPQEALALVVLCNELGKQDGVPFLADARTAALKLESVLPSRIREYLRELTPAVAMNMAPVNQAADQPQVYHTLLHAIAAGNSVRITYESPAEDAPFTTRLNPYRLMFSRRSWYVIGRSTLHRETRTFNVGRIREIIVTEDAYQIPRGFSLDRYLGNAWHLIPEPGPDSEVHIRFAPMVARNVAEVAWHKTQRLHFNDDGTLDFHATVSGVSEISWWVLGYGDQAEVLAPRHLRKLVAERCLRVAQRSADCLEGNVRPVKLHRQQFTSHSSGRKQPGREPATAKRISR